ncbi:MAG: hypothetical protein B7Z37_25455 [Verrucomicrobia bacterium 12-59-8]|nr:MAG: hypothetical protein B7Z37_25455 [Verrucomicrobia bacterium 12-59-8]
MPHPSEVLQYAQKVPHTMWATIAIVGFFAFAAGLAFAKGVVQQIINVVTLALCAAAAWYVFMHRVVIFGAAGMHITTNRMIIASVIAAGIMFAVCKVGKYFLVAFGLMRLLGGLTGWKGLLVSFLPSGALMWMGSVALRIVGSLYGMENASEIVKKGGSIESQAKSIFYSLSQKIDNSPIGGLVKKLDPYDIKPTANLARLLILWPEGTMWQRLAMQSPATANALNHPLIAQLGYDPEVRKAIDNKDFAGLMQLPKVEKVANHPDLQPVLGGMQLEMAMDSVVYKQPPLPQPVTRY